MDLKPLVGNSYSGLVTFSDVHAHAKKLQKGIKFALDNDLFMVFLGDLVDGHHKPLETVVAVKAILDENRGVFIIGNHEDKFYRYAKGNKVVLKKAQLKTLEHVGASNLDYFLQTIVDIIEHRNTSHHWQYGNWVFTHGACAREFWDKETEHPNKTQKKIKHKAMYGEVNNEVDDEGFPVRLYTWVDEIPSGHNVVVGHDRKPFGQSYLQDIGPLHKENEQGGRAIFTDTGCGKGGHLTLTVFNIKEGALELIGHETV